MCSTAQLLRFKGAHRAEIKVEVQCESLGYDVERRFVILGGGSWSVAFNELSKPARREGKKALNHK